MCECGKVTNKLRRGMCGACYARFLRRQPGSLRVVQTPVERFWAKVSKGPDCWLWLAARTPKGYGQFSPHRQHVYAHRYAYELLVGPIPSDLTIDHLCEVKGCVNPAHMEVVTRGENTRRAARRVTCPHCGQGMVPPNLSRHVAARHSPAQLGANA